MGFTLQGGEGDVTWVNDHLKKCGVASKVEVLSGELLLLDFRYLFGLWLCPLLAL